MQLNIKNYEIYFHLNKYSFRFHVIRINKIKIDKAIDVLFMVNFGYIRSINHYEGHDLFFWFDVLNFNHPPNEQVRFGFSHYIEEKQHEYR